MLLLLVWAPLFEKQDYVLSKHNIIFFLFKDFLPVPYMTEHSRWGGSMMTLFSVLPTVPRVVPALWWKSLSHVWLFATPWTMGSMEFSRPLLEWVAIPFSRGSSWPSNRTRVSCIAGGFFTRQVLPERCSININWMNEWIIFSLLVLYWLKVFFFPAKHCWIPLPRLSQIGFCCQNEFVKETNIWLVAWIKSCDCWGLCCPRSVPSSPGPVRLVYS